MAVVRAKSAKQVGRYQLVYELGQSYLGPLWAVRVEGGEGAAQLAMLRLVSLAGLDADTRVRLLEAAWQAMEVRHERIAAVTDVVASDGELGVITDYLEGLPLRSLHGLAGVKRKPIPIPIALRIVLDLTEAVAGLQRATVELGEESLPLFGGLSADSLLVGTDGRASVLDVVVASAASSIPAFGSNPERIAYAAPEQVSTPPHADRRTEVFAIGVLAWELFSNRRLFLGSDKAIVQKVLTGKIPKLDEVKRRGDPDIPADIVSAVTRSLDRDPDRRFATAEELASALAASGVAPADGAEVRVFVESVADGALGRIRDALQDTPGGTRSAIAAKPKPAGQTVRPIAAPSVVGAAKVTVSDSRGPSRDMKAPPPGKPEAAEARPQRMVKPLLPAQPVVVARAGRPGPFVGPGKIVAELAEPRKRQPTMIGIAPPTATARTPTLDDRAERAAVAALPVVPPARAAAPTLDDAVESIAPISASDEPTGQYDARVLRQQVESMGRKTEFPAASTPNPPASEFPEPPTAPRAAAGPEAGPRVLPSTDGAAIPEGGWLDAPDSSPNPEPRPLALPEDPRSRAAAAEIPPEASRPLPAPPLVPAESVPIPSAAQSARVPERTAARTAASVAPPTFLASQIPPPLIHDPRAGRATARPPTAPRHSDRAMTRRIAVGVAVSLALVVASAALAVLALRSKGGTRTAEPEMGTLPMATESTVAVAAPTVRAAAVEAPPSPPMDSPKSAEPGPAQPAEPPATATADRPVAPLPRPGVGSIPRRPPPKKKPRYVPNDI